MSDITAPPAARVRLFPALPVVLTGMVVLTVGFGLWERLVDHHRLGTPLPPFVMGWEPAVRWTALAAVAVWGTATFAVPWLSTRMRTGVVYAAFSYVVMLALGLSLNAARAGVLEWARVFTPGPNGSREAGFEYLPGLPALSHGVHAFLANFPELLSQLPTHAKGNPPGTLLAIDLLGLTTPVRLAAFCIGVGALVAPLTYGLGRAVGGEQRGRQAAILTAFSPALQLFGVTSVDYVFATIATATVWLLIAGEARGNVRSWLVFLVGCGLAAIGSLASWLLLVMPVTAALIVLLRSGMARALYVTIGAFAAIAAVNLLLFLWQGYNPVEVVQMLQPIYAHGAAAQRPYAFWLFGSPAAWAVFLGPPVAWMAAEALADRDPAALALAATVIIAAVLGFTKAETERIWLPFVPLACVAAAGRPIRRLPIVLAVVGLQAVLVELLFYTVW